MPFRRTPLINDQIYHIFNKSIAGTKLFKDNQTCRRFINLIDFYRFQNNQFKFSYFSKMPPKRRNKYLDSLYSSARKVEIYSFSLMPNHYHLLVKQIKDNGISDFVALLQNGFVKYFNLKSDRKGPLFEGRFSAVRVQTEEQLLHVARYIHLNQLSSSVLKNITELENFPWNSYTDYISGHPRPFIGTSLILKFFKNLESFKSFTANQVQYQKELDMIKHLCQE